MASSIDATMAKIQNHIYPRRVRAKDFFKDYDPLRSGRVSSAQFVRAMSSIGVRLTDAEAEGLADHFTDGVQKPQNVNYNAFCEHVDGVFVTPRIEKSPGHVVAPVGHGVTGAFIHQDVEDQEKLDHVLHRVALLVKTRGVVLKYQFQDFERSDATSLTVPRRSGKVTVEQFCRCFPFLKDLEKEDVLLLIERYSTPGGDIHFQQMHNDISDASASSGPPPFPRSDLVLRPDTNTWSQQQLSAAQKVQAKVVEKRVRLKEHFQDFDPLRKGFCSPGQVKTVLALLKVEVGTADFDELAAIYTRDDGMFCYEQFSADIDTAFTCKGLESNPLAVIEMPSPATTMPARRNRMSLTPEEQETIAVVEEKIRAQTGVRRILIRPTFQDFDPTRRGHVTKGQFGRVMHCLGFELDESSVNILCKAYCDLGNHVDFNYLDFCASCDPPSAHEALAMEQTMQPYEKPKPSTYFSTKTISALGGQ